MDSHINSIELFEIILLQIQNCGYFQERNRICLDNCNRKENSWVFIWTICINSHFLCWDSGREFVLATIMKKRAVGCHLNCEICLQQFLLFQFQSCGCLGQKDSIRSGNHHENKGSLAPISTVRFVCNNALSLDIKFGNV